MRPLAASITVALVIASAVGIHRDARATTGVLRCSMPDGTYVYSNKACSSFGGRAAPLPAEVLNRIARQQRYEARLAASNALPDASVAEDELPQDGQWRQAATTRRPVSDGCAATPEQLALDLQASVAMGDVNRVAESFDWAGMQHAQAHRILSELQQFSGNTVVDAEYFDAGGGYGIGDAFASAGDEGGLMQVVFDGDGAQRVADFEVRIDNGCYLLRYA